MTTTTTYALEMRDECSNETVAFDHRPNEIEIGEACTEWVKDGEWGNDGACIRVWWELTDEDGNEIDSGPDDVEVEPDHDYLISDAGGDTNCGHDWTSEGEGGCDENPGVWSTGGTSMKFASHCRKCGLHRTERSTGSQCSPGEHDTVSYEQPESWCVECQTGNECDCVRIDRETLESLDYHMCPADAGQIVEYTYAVCDLRDGYIIRRRHDRSDGETSYEAAGILDTDANFEPQNGDTNDDGNWQRVNPV